MLDIIGRLVDRIMNMNNARTFDRTTDSLEAISNALGIGPGVGLWMFGIVDATQVASAITIITNNLQNVPNDLLEGQFYMQVLYNTSVPGTAPEGETVQITNFVQGGALQTFTVDALSADVEAGDMVCIFHQSILPTEILARGTLSTSSATLPVDNSRTEALDYFKGCLLMTTEGDVRFQPRRIVTSSAAGIFTLDPSNPFTAVPGLVDYIIIDGQAEFVPGVDAVVNRTPGDVVGGKADTAIVAPDNVSSAVRYLKGILNAIGISTDAGDLGTLFGRNKKVVEAVHVHVLLVVGNTDAMNANLDTALLDFLEGKGYDVVVADPPDVTGNLELHFDAVVISATCVAADAGALANLKTVDCPVICHSADIAVSAVLNLGGTAHTHAAQTQIEIVDNTIQWFLEQDQADLTVTASATIYAMNTKTANAITLAEEATGTGNHLTFVLLQQGQEDGGTPAYAPDFDRYFIGVANFIEINAAFTAILEEFYDHIIHEVRFSPEVVVTPKKVYQENIPDSDFSLAAIDNALGSAPPAADAENSIVDIDQKQNKAFVLRSLWVNITSWGTGASMDFQLWVLINGVVISVDSVTVNVLGIQNLTDIFGLQEVHADGIFITVITNAGNTGACSGTYRYAEAKR